MPQFHLLVERPSKFGWKLTDELHCLQKRILSSIIRTISMYRTCWTQARGHWKCRFRYLKKCVLFWKIVRLHNGYTSSAQSMNIKRWFEVRVEDSQEYTYCALWLRIQACQQSAIVEWAARLYCPRLMRLWLWMELMMSTPLYPSPILFQNWSVAAKGNGQWIKWMEMRWFVTWKRCGQIWTGRILHSGVSQNCDRMSFAR